MHLSLHNTFIITHKSFDIIIVTVDMHGHYFCDTQLYIVLKNTSEHTCILKLSRKVNGKKKGIS